MKNILVINGPSINLIGIREPHLYGNKTYEDLVNLINKKAEEFNLRVSIIQTSHEGVIIDSIIDAYKKYQGIIINAGGYTHTSIAILDALKAVDIDTIEVHLTDINKREEYRHRSFISEYAKKTICGKGFLGYVEALEYFKEG